MAGVRKHERQKRSTDLIFVAFVTVTMTIAAMIAFEPTSAWSGRWLTTPMGVHNITLVQDANNPARINASVHVKSTSGINVRYARVYVTIAGPDGQATALDMRTGNSGVATFGVPVFGNGQYTVSVTNITKSRYVYDASLNTMSSADLLLGSSGDQQQQGQEPPATPENSAPDPGHGNQGTGACGEPLDAWHPPVVNGCETGHEHGDAPPQWIVDAGYDVKFHGHFNTSAVENTIKHAAMKGFSSSMDGVDIYFRVHTASNVLERSSRFHSYEVWARDPSGNVSHWQGWYNSGDPVADRIPRTQGDPGRRPVVLVVDQASWDAGIRCEQWYAHTARWSWDFGWTICNAQALFYPGENNELGVENWRLTGSSGTNRRLEAAWYGSDSRYDTNRDVAPKDVQFWATQFGEIVSGPDDALCSATTTVYGQTYQNVCLSQFIASTMASVEFPGNAEQKQFPSTGITADGNPANASPPTTPEPPVVETVEPTQEAPAEPTAEPTQEPTAEPTAEPTQEPPAEPTQEAPAEPTAEPTQEAPAEPTAEPTQEAPAEPTHDHAPEPPVVPTAPHDNGGAHAASWHAPTDHEHGHAPPAWAEQWSMQRFGHGVIYGGDEATPGENVMKHNAFKGQIVPSAAGGEAYVRYHAASNPADRMGRFHSYEIYYRDTAGNISFLQGYKDCGNPATNRFPRAQGDPLVRPAILVVDQEAWDAGIRFEQWYCHGTGLGLVEFAVSIGNSSTLWHPDEKYEDPMDRSLWRSTGASGTNRLVDFFMIESRFNGVTGDFYLTHMGQPANSGDSGALLQYVAPTFYDDMRLTFGVERISGQAQVTHSCGTCGPGN